jgi:hypothetical protein
LLGQLSDKKLTSVIHFSTVCAFFAFGFYMAMSDNWTTIIELAQRSSLHLSRAERDQLVIFDPRCAPQIRPLLTASDLRPWHSPIGEHWIIAAPAAPPPRLLQWLEAKAPTDAPPHWWHLALPTLPAPRLIVALHDPTLICWETTQAVISGPALVLAHAEPWLLAWLHTSTGQALVQKPTPLAALDALRTRPLPAPTREHLGALALQRVELARQQHTADAAYARRLLADFGPPGSRLSTRLLEWWHLDALALFAALEEDLRNGVPLEFQPFYQQRHTEACTARAALLAQAAEIEATLESLVNTCD